MAYAYVSTDLPWIVEVARHLADPHAWWVHVISNAGEEAVEQVATFCRDADAYNEPEVPLNLIRIAEGVEELQGIDQVVEVDLSALGPKGETVGVFRFKRVLP